VRPRKLSFWLLASGFWLLASGGWLAATDAVSIIPNGDFSAADQDHADTPAHWDKPDGLGVQWAATPDGKGRAIRMDTAVSEQDMVAQWRKVGIDKWDVPHATTGPMGENYGLSFYSDAVPIEAGRAYRLSYDFQGAAGGVKVWVRGYGEIRKDADHASEHRRMWEVFVNGNAEGAKALGDCWTRVTQDVYPTKHTPKVSEVKIMLYAYYPSGVYWFRDVRLEPIAEDAPKP
jgi:hypothetical protein